MVLLGLLALSLALATLVPQIPPQAVDDPQAWLAVQSGVLGQRNGLFRALGLFDVYHAWWFHLFLALTGLALFVRLVEAGELAWRASSQRRWSAESFAFWGQDAPRASLTSSLLRVDALARVDHLLAEQRFHQTYIPHSDAPSFIAVQRKACLWALPVALAALLVALAGLVIASNRSWHSEDWQPAPNQVRAIGHGTAYSIRLDAFEPQTASAGPCDYKSTLTWLEGSDEAAQSSISLGRPATFQGVTVRQVGYVPIVKVQGQDNSGQPLALQTGGQDSRSSGQIELAFSSSEAQDFVLIPDSDLYLAVTVKPPAADGQATLEIARLGTDADNPEVLTTLHESGEVPIDDLTLSVELTYRPVLRLDRRPAMWLLIGSVGVAVVALAVHWLVPPRLLWFAATMDEDSQTVICALALPNARGSRWWPSLVNWLQGALANDD